MTGLKGDYLGMTLSVTELDIENLEYFRHCAAHDFHLQKCSDCGIIRYPPGAACHHCGSRESAWVPVEGKGEDVKGNSFHSACPICDAPILSLRMPNGGWVHYERGIGLSRLKHPCFYIGEDIAKARDELGYAPVVTREQGLAEL